MNVSFDRFLNFPGKQYIFVHVVQFISIYSEALNLKSNNT